MKHTALVDLGLEPHLLSETLIESLFSITTRYSHRVRPEALRPTVDWRKAANKFSVSLMRGCYMKGGNADTRQPILV